MTNHAVSQMGRRKNRSKPAEDILQKTNNAKREYLQRLATARAHRERMVERLRPEHAAKLVALARSEREKRIAAGKIVAPTLDEYRRGLTIYVGEPQRIPLPPSSEQPEQ